MTIAKTNIYCILKFFHLWHVASYFTHLVLIYFIYFIGQSKFFFHILCFIFIFWLNVKSIFQQLVLFEQVREFSLLFLTDTFCAENFTTWHNNRLGTFVPLISCSGAISIATLINFSGTISVAPIFVLAGMSMTSA